MKKIIYSAMAVAMLATTSCKDDFAESFVGEEATVEFSISTPEIGTRYGEGTTVNKLHYAVYDNGTLLKELTKTDVVFNGSATLQLPLKTGKTYDLVFWADHEDAPYKVDFSKQTMTIDYTSTVSCNNEELDAFYKHEKITVEGNRTLDVKLTRPFAQLNIAASDFEEARKANYVPNASSIKVYGAANTLNFLSGAITGNVDVVTFASTAIPTEDLTVNDITYDYLAMTYVLPADNKTVMDIDFTIVGNTHSETRKVGSVPFQSNYRTNIYGNILTSQQEVNITIDPAFGGDKTVDALFQAAAFGGEVTLTEDVVLTTPLNVQANMTIDLNGKTISAVNAKGDGAVIEVAEGVSAKLIGGTIENTTPNGDATINNAGELVLNGVHVEGAPLADGGYPEYAVYANGGTLVVEEGTKIESYRGAIRLANGADVTINGGEVKTTINLGLTSHVIYAYGSNSKLTINDGEFAMNYVPTADSGASVICPAGATIDIYGGNFEFTGPNGQGGVFQNYMGYGAPVNVYGGVYNDATVNKNLAAGYKALKVDNLYYVLPETIANAASTAGVTTVTESTADVSAAISGGDAALFMWNDVAYIAETGKVSILASEEGKTTVRGIVESTALTSATVAEGIEVVGNRTFRKCANLETVALPNTLTEIGPAVFQSCSKLANVTIPATVKTIGEGAFAECTSLTSINIPNGITRLEKDVLRNTGLTSIEIPASVNYIGTYAFRDCESLTEVTILSPEFTIENNSFTNMAAPVPTMTIKVVNAEMKAYVESVLTNYDKSYITVVVM